MTRPAARVLALLEILQRGGIRSTAELAAELGVDARTVRRYIEQLTEIGAPVVGVRGRYGGYRLAPGERMPPLMLDEDEALAVVLGLLSAERAGLVAPGGAAASAARKVRGSLPEVVARRVAAVLENSDFTDAAVAAVQTDGRALLLVASAAREQRPLWFRYSARDGARTARTLLPYGVVAHAGRWYATGHDSSSGQLRTFRLDRMSELSPLPGTFEAPQGFDAVDAVLTSLATTPWAHDVAVVVAGPVAEVRRALPRGLARVEAVDGGEAVDVSRAAGVAESGAAGGEWTRVRLRAERLDWVAALFAGLNRRFVIEGPDELRDAVRALARNLPG